MPAASPDWFLEPLAHRFRFAAVDRARHGIDRVLDLGARRAGSLFTQFDAAKVMAAAEQVDARRRQGASLPLAGVRISIKDLFDEAGEVTAAGSTYLRGRAPAASDAIAVSRLIEAGAVPFGRTSMSEFAYSGIGLNPHFGTPGNVRDPARIPGGSTSGGALTVALGLCDAALGSDTGGSIRIPAALNGLAGFKPSQSAVPLEGAFPLSATYDSIGPIAPTIALCAAIHAVLSGQARPPQRRETLAGLRVGVIRHLLTDSLEAQVASDFDHALGIIQQAGATIADVDVPGLEAAGPVNRIVVATEAFRLHEASLQELEAVGDPHVLRRIRFGGTVSAAEREDALAVRQDARRTFNGIARAFDVLVAPTLPVTAPLIVDAEAEFDRHNALILRNPSVVNFLDGCAATIPMSGPASLAAGLMVIGPNGADWPVLAVAEAFEALLSR